MHFSRTPQEFCEKQTKNQGIYTTSTNYKHLQASDVSAREPSSSPTDCVSGVALGGGCKNGIWESNPCHRTLSDSFQGAPRLHVSNRLAWHVHPSLCVAASRALHSNEQTNGLPTWHSGHGSAELLQEQSCEGLDTESDILKLQVWYLWMISCHQRTLCTLFLAQPNLSATSKFPT